MALLNFLMWVDSLIALAGYCLVAAVVVWWIVSPAGRSVWFLVRPFAVMFGSVPRTAYDFLVIGWKAERRGKWAEALVAYDRALELEPKHADAQNRRSALLAVHPELVESKKQDNTR